MLKEKRQLFEFLFVISDLVVVSLAWCLAYFLRFQTELIPVEKGIPEFSHYFTMILFIWLIWAFVFRRFGLYRPMRGVRRIRELWLLINANALATVILIAAVYLFREKSIPFSRVVFIYFWFLATIFTMLERSLVRFVLRELRRKGYNLRYMLIVGSGKVAGDIASRVRLHQEVGVQLLGCLSKEGTEKRGPKGVPIIGSYADLERIIKTFEIDQIMVALPLEDSNYLPEIMALLEDSLLDVRVVPDIYQFVSLGGTIEEFEGLPIISLQGSPLGSFDLVAKRAFDLVLGTVLTILLSPILLLTALLVKLTSRGPVFYKQERVSVDGTRFRILKFRTMYVDAEEDGPRWNNEERVTPVGKFLRLFNLDELPQLLNVIRGDMSIVGPRPERPVFIEEFRKHIPKYMLRHKVPAGMTGWAQIHGWRGDTSIHKRIEYDLYYIENWSLVLDLKIMILTLFKGFGNRGAV